MISLSSTSPADRRRIYLNDHLAGASAGLSLARRIRDSHRGTPTGEAFEQLVPEIEADEQTLRRVLEAVGAAVAVPKLLIAALAERAGRLKLNGQLLGQSPLSLFVELEAMSLGITGKAKLWAALRAVQDRVPELAEFDFETLARRAEEQQATVEELRLAAVADALAG